MRRRMGLEPNGLRRRTKSANLADLADLGAVTSAHFQQPKGLRLANPPGELAVTGGTV
jgi:hypothetical protein